VLDLLDDLRRKQGMALLLITHDLGVVARMADRIGVMYAGQLVEEAPRAAFFSPAGPSLFGAPVRRAARCRAARRAAGDDSRQRAAGGCAACGCRFVERCGEAMPVCARTLPPWRDVDAGQRVRCHLPGAAPGGGGEKSAPATRRLRRDREAAAGGPRPQVHFPIRRGILQRAVGAVRAVDGMSLQLMPGRTLALVGESGCGKTTAGKAMLQLIRPTAAACCWTASS
jgi:peptide/nickel transport system ATP-binding protein